MFGWLFSSCPVDLHARRWIEERFHWLTEQFGQDVLLDSPTVTPTDEFFPDPYDGSEDAARELVNRIAGYMLVPESMRKVEFFTADATPVFVNEDGHAISGAAAGLYDEVDGSFRLNINRCELDHPMMIVGTIAHELAHSRLFGEDRISTDAFDNELLTDLTVVFHGMGIFLANSPRNWDSDNKTWPGTDIVRPEYMSLPMFGYAMALRAALRYEENPKWMKHLNWHARSELKQGLRFFRRS